MTRIVFLVDAGGHSSFFSLQTKYKIIVFQPNIVLTELSRRDATVDIENGMVSTLVLSVYVLQSVSYQSIIQNTELIPFYRLRAT